MSQHFATTLSLSPNGDIRTYSFVKLDPSSDLYGLQAGSGDVPVGIAQPGTYRFPDGEGVNSTLAAVAGGVPPVIASIGDIVPLKAGTGGWARCDYIKPDSNGYGVSALPGDVYGAYALTTAAAGEVHNVLILPAGQKVNGTITSSATNITLTAAMARSLIRLTAADIAATLPLISTVPIGTEYLIMCDATAAAITAGSTGVLIKMHATDRPTLTFIGAGVTPTAARDLLNTKATAKQGDFMRIISFGTTWYVVGKEGTWALQA